MHLLFIGLGDIAHRFVETGKESKLLTLSLLPEDDKLLRYGEMAELATQRLRKPAVCIELWQKVLNALNAGEMPPEDSEQPGNTEKADFLDDLAEVHVLDFHRQFALLDAPRLRLRLVAIRKYELSRTSSETIL